MRGGTALATLQRDVKRDKIAEDLFDWPNGQLGQNTGVGVWSWNYPGQGSGIPPEVYAGVFTGGGNGAGAMRYLRDGFHVDQYSEITLGANAGSGVWRGAAVRVSDGNDAARDFYVFEVYDASQWIAIRRVSDGTWTQITPEIISPVPYTEGSKIRLEVTGTQLRGYVNGKCVMTVSDSVLTGGRPGIVGANVNSPILAWEGGNLIEDNRRAIAPVGRRRVTSQPQTLPRIDWNNPLTKGLSIVLVGQEERNLVTGLPLAVGGTENDVLVGTGPTGRYRARRATAFNGNYLIPDRTYPNMARSFGVVTGLVPSGESARYIVCFNTSPPAGADTFAFDGNGYPYLQLASSTRIPGVAGNFSNSTLSFDLNEPNYKIWHQGVAIGSANVYSGNGNITGLFGVGAGYTSAYGRFPLFVAWDRILSPAEHAEFNSDPWSLFASSRSRTYIEVPPRAADRIEVKRVNQRAAARQPYRPVIDWSNPITRDLLFVHCPTFGHNDICGNAKIHSGRIPDLKYISDTGMMVTQDGSGVIQYQAPVDANDQMAKLFDRQVLTVATYCRQPSEVNGQPAIFRGNGSATPSWSIGLHSGSVDGPLFRLGSFGYGGEIQDFNTLEKFRFLALTGDGTTARGYVDGREWANGAYTPVDYQYSINEERSVFIGAGPSAPVGLSNTHSAVNMFWGRALSAAEIKSLSDNPWQIFKGGEREVLLTQIPRDLTIAFNSSTIGSSAAQINFPGTGSYTFNMGTVKGVKVGQYVMVGARLSATTPGGAVQKILVGDQEAAITAEYSSGMYLFRWGLFKAPVGGDYSIKIVLAQATTVAPWTTYAADWAVIYDEAGGDLGFGAEATALTNNGSITTESDRSAIFDFACTTNDSNGRCTNYSNWDALNAYTYERIGYTTNAGAAGSKTFEWNSANSHYMVEVKRYVVLAPVLEPRFGRPISDVTKGSWVADTGTDLFSRINEEVADDNSYISVDGPGSVCEMKLKAMGDPATSSGHVLKLRMASQYSNSARLKIMQGTTQIASWDQSLTTSVALYNLSLSGAQIDSITDYTDLRLRIEGL